jgi:hypothetical protein
MNEFKFFWQACVSELKAKNEEKLFKTLTQNDAMPIENVGEPILLTPLERVLKSWLALQKLQVVCKFIENLFSRTLIQIPKYPSKLPQAIGAALFDGAEAFG